MNFRLTAVFLGLVLVLVAGLMVAFLLEDDQGASATAEGLMAPLAAAGVTEKEIDTVELVRTEPTEQTLVFSKGADGRWELTRPTTARVEGFAVEGLVRDLFNAKPVADPNLTENLSVHGLDRPTLRVTLRAGADRSQTVNVGNTTIGGDQAITFVTTSAAPKTPLAVRKSDLSSPVPRRGHRRRGVEDGQVAARLPRPPRPRGRRPRPVRGPVGEGRRPAARSWRWSRPRPASGRSPARRGTAPPTTRATARRGRTPPRSPACGRCSTCSPRLQVGGPDDYIEQPGDDLAKYGLDPANRDRSASS